MNKTRSEEDNYMNFYPNFKSNINIDSVLNILETYRQDSLSNIRFYSYSIAHDCYQNNKSNSVQVINFILKGVVDSIYIVCKTCTSYLDEMPSNRYSKKNTEQILNMMDSVTDGLDDMVYILGRLKHDKVEEKLTKLFLAGRFKENKYAVAFYLAMSRLGDKESTDFILEKLRERKKINDSFIYLLAKRLVYTLNKSIYDYLVEIIYSDEKNCKPSNAEMDTKINCAYRILEYISPHIKNFPLKVNHSGDIITNDYIEALDIAREWLANNQDFEIIK
ncbi:MAG: hypothetical protein N4A49_01985 [Marinifilaceae bacterium]|jgi:hypothetical protein|nr:hypothetical protein [Marinifilaceae bacterium]